MLWLQGLGADHTAWTVQMAHFARSYRCILPDSRDTGRSSRAGTGYGMRDLASDALCVLDSARVDRAHVVGLSMGASVAQHVALLAPERVRSLVLLSSFARPDARLSSVVAFWPELYRRLGRVLFHRHAEGWMFSPSYFEEPANPRALRRYIEADRHPQEPDDFARQVEAALAHDTLEQLGDVEVPALVVHGELDILVPKTLGEQLARALPNARFELRRGVAHSVNLEQQRPFNGLLEAFFRAQR
ncbi:MAG: alpha/beta hydrolase [Chloroflexota bacterium]|nr:alpha/beta hydrolase [Chloroflexota bacterium]